MKPVFSMTSDSTEPEVKSCTARWKFGESVTSLKFEDGASAFAMNNVVEAAYRAGLSDGRREVAQAVIRAANEAISN